VFHKLQFRMDGGFTEAELQGIKEDALGLLSDVGVRIDHEGILKFLEAQRGLTRSGNRIRLSRDLVEEWLPVIRQKNYEYSYNRSDDAWRLVTPYMAAQFRDPAGGAVRPATTEDQRLCVKLGEVLGMYGPEPLHVQEGPVEIRQLLSFKIALEHSREIGGWAPAMNPVETRFMIEMGQAAGRKPPYGCMEIPISPLRLNAELLAMLFERRERQDQLIGIVVGGGAAPMPGATAPLSFPACLSQGLAEALAAYIIPQVIDRRLLGYCSFGGFLFNLRTMDTFHPYFPESLMYGAMLRQVLQYTLGRKFGHWFKPDFYANPGKLYQVGFAGATDALLGARSIHVGAEKGDVLSPLNMVIAADLLRHMRKYVEGLPLVHSATLTRELIEPGLESGMYTDLESTLNYRELYVNPRLLFQHDSHEALMAAAREEMNRLLALHDFALPREAQAEMEKVFASAQKALVR